MVRIMLMVFVCASFVSKTLSLNLKHFVSSTESHAWWDSVLLDEILKGGLRLHPYLVKVMM